MQNSASYAGTGILVHRCTIQPKACTSVRCVGSSIQYTVGFLPTKQHFTILLGSRSSECLRQRSHGMKVAAFGTILSNKMNTPPLDAFLHKHVFHSSQSYHPTQSILTTSNS